MHIYYQQNARASFNNQRTDRPRLEHSYAAYAVYGGTARMFSERTPDSSSSLRHLLRH
jgi:hypothetical protein